jgi:glycerate dehydrogenase
MFCGYYAFTTVSLKCSRSEAMMKIVVLDGHTLNPGDLSWNTLARLGACEIYPRSTPDEVVPRCQEAECVLTNKVCLGAKTIQALPMLKYIGVLATGYDVVDIEAARQRQIPVSNVPAYSSYSVAQMTWAHILNFTQHVGQHSESVTNSQWSQTADFCYWNFPLIELQGLTLGIIGLGRIGQIVARIAISFGMNVIYFDPLPRDPSPGSQPVTLDDLFQNSDIISLHCPLTPKTQTLVDRKRLAQMKHNAFLVNTSRGALIDETALADALQNRTITAAGLDVLAQEPPPADHSLLRLPNCYLTPHIAWATRAARQRLLDITIANLVAYQQHRPINVVN